MKNKTVYHDMGYLMAESLGLVSEEKTKKPEGRFDYMQDTPQGEAATRRAQIDAAVKRRQANAAQIQAARGGAVTTTPRSGNPTDIRKKRGERP
jgi:hypothetical protein